MKNFRTIFCRLYRLFIIQLVIGCMGLTVKAQELNHPAPTINFSACLNDLHLKPDFYKGKTIVLDFWATWCGPCIASHPHLDSLSRQFSSDSVVFAIISCEDKNKIAKFLKGRSIKAYYLVDAVTAASTAKAKGGFAGLTYQAFNIINIPSTIIIDKNGRLVWTGNTAGLTTSILKQVMSGQLQGIADRNRKTQNYQNQRDSIFAATKKDTLKEYGVTLATAQLPYTDYSMSAGPNNTKHTWAIECKGRPFGSYFESLTNTPQTRFVDKTNMGSIYARAESAPGATQRDFYAATLNLLCKAYKIKLIKTQKLVDAYELKIIDSVKFNLRAKTLAGPKDHGGYADDGTHLVATNFPFEAIVKNLEAYLEIPVIIADSRFLQKRCDMSIEKGDFDHLSKFLTETYGVQLNKVKREIEFTDIVKAE